MDKFSTRKTIRRGILAFSLVMAATYCAHACSCYPKEPVCEAYGDAKAVSVGKVIEGKSFERMSDMLKAGTTDLTFKFAVSYNRAR